MCDVHEGIEKRTQNCRWKNRMERIAWKSVSGRILLKVDGKN
jgi:hypothetical protein